MAFTENQIRKLRRHPSRKFVKTREHEGREFQYLEGWQVISEANRIFGYDAWNRETVWFECVWRQPQGRKFAAAYLARVRIVVRTEKHQVIREGSGAGEAIASTPGQAHELAAKAAETDATKRALSTFGSPFGLSLYATPEKKPQVEPSSKTEFSSEADAVPPEKPIQPRVNGHAVKSVAKASAHRPDTIDKSKLTLPEPKRIRDRDHLKMVAAQPCLICGRTPSQAHHLRFAQPRAMGRKVSDQFAVPLCVGHHSELHRHGDEKQWWQKQKINPLEAAQTLWLQTTQGLDIAADPIGAAFET